VIKIVATVFLLITFPACKQPEIAIVNPVYVDSLIQNYTTSEAARTNEGDILFWKKRMDTLPENYVNGPKYAAALALRFPHIR